MISWLQQSLQKHYKWIFSILLAIIIVSFVFTIGSSPGLVSGKNKVRKNLFYGYNLSSHEDLQELNLEANASSLINYGVTLDFLPNADWEILKRPALLSLADTLQIPPPNEFELIKFIQSRPMFLSDKGSFDQKRYNDFIDLVKKSNALSESLVKQTLENDYRIDIINDILAGPGNVTPYESQLSIQRQKTLWSIDLASFSPSISPSQPIKESELNEFFSKNAYRFNNPEKINASFLAFPTSSFLNKLGNIPDSDLESYFKKNYSLFNIEEKNISSSFPQLKPQILEKFKNERLISYQ